MESPLIVTLAVTMAATALAFLLYRERVRQRARRRVGRLSQINLYPVKSGPALRLSWAQVTASGLRYKSLRDRQFVLVGAKSFISILKNLKLTACSLEYNEPADELVLSHPDMSPLRVPADRPPERGDRTQLDIPWYDGTEKACMDYGEKYSRWFTTMLGEKCTLGYFDASLSDHKVNPANRVNDCADVILADSKILYQNTHPYMVASQTSLNDLNSRLVEPLTFQQFRPNLVVDSGDSETSVEPYDEDNWRNIAVGSDVTLYNERACLRCPMIYVDYSNGRMRANKEPMTTLLRYRRGQGKHSSRCVFGINASAVSAGRIGLGDSVTVTY